MAEKTLIAHVRPDAERPGTHLVTSPAVGMVYGMPAPGAFLNRYDAISRIRIMGELHVLRLPRDLHGWVVRSAIGSELTAVAFGDLLLHLDSRLEQAGTTIAELDRGMEGRPEDAAGNAIVVKASTDGIFYRRASPGAKAFVEVGDPVGRETVLGLIEVMKCFNQVRYGGPGFPEAGEVARVLVDDATEVRFGQPLFWIRPRD